MLFDSPSCSARSRRRSGEQNGRWRLAVSSGAVFEAPALVAGLDDVAVMGEPVEESGGHLGVAEDTGPFAEGEVGGEDDGGLLIEAADQVEEQLAADWAKGR